MVDIDRLIEFLRAFQLRKKMYLRSVNQESVQSFLTGFGLACHGCGLPHEHELWWVAQESRGWKREACGPVRQMEAKGMSDAEIVEELIEIEIQRLLEHQNRAGVAHD